MEETAKNGKELLVRLQGSIKYAEDNNDNMNTADWVTQSGILLTPNEAKLVAQLLKNFLAEPNQA